MTKKLLEKNGLSEFAKDIKELQKLKKKHNYSEFWSNCFRV